MPRSASGPWTGHYSPSSVRWWMETLPSARWDGSAYGHFATLLEMLSGRSADDTEALSHCFQRVVNEGAGHRVTGQWCVCLSEDPPSAGEARGSIGGDGMAALIAVKTDLERAADALPITWKSTERIFEAQERHDIWNVRYAAYTSNQRVREIDRWLEPRDPLLGRPRSTPLALYLMSVALGGSRLTCEWPRRQPIPLRTTAARHKEAA